MNNIIVSENSQKGELTRDSINALVSAGIVPKDTPPSQIQIFAHVCAEKGISPFSKEIYLLGYGNKYSIITGIEGFRKIAARTGQLAGCDDAKYDLKSDGRYKTIAEYAKGEMPVTCTVSIYRIVNGVRCPFTHTAKFSEFSSGQQKWLTMPFQMIAKVAEAFALRKGFGDATSGIHIEEEAASMHVTEVKPEIILTEEQKQAKENAYVDSETLLTGIKQMIEKCADYDSCRNEGNKIATSEKFKVLIPEHQNEFKTIVKKRLNELQDVEA